MEAKGTSPFVPNGVKKSNSSASAGGRSTKSHESVSFLGVHPLGSLRVVRPDSSPRTVDQLGEDDDGPPPLGPPAGGSYTVGGQSPTRQRGSYGKPHKRSSRSQKHQMGGGDVVIIIDLPDVFTVGYDTLAFTARHFVGVRDLPPGPHFFWVSHPSGVAARSGVWLQGSDTRDYVHVVQWDSFNEILTEATRSESRNRAEAVPSIHGKLIPYPDPTSVNGAIGKFSPLKLAANLDIWQQLTQYITTSVLDRINGPQTGGWISHTLDRAQGAVKLSAEVVLERAVPNRNLQQRQLNFAFETTTRLFSLQSFGSDRTYEAIDPTTYILSQIDNPTSNLVYKDLVGEFQFSFIVGSHLGNDACLEQWWFILLKLLVKSHRLVEKKPVLAAALLNALTAQIRYSSQWMSSHIFEYSEANSRELRISLIIYKRRLDEFMGTDETKLTSNHTAVSVAFHRLECTLNAIGWDIGDDYIRKGKVVMEDGEEIDLELTELEAEDERGEWAPEIVEFDENGRQRGLISWSN